MNLFKALNYFKKYLIIDKRLINCIGLDTIDRRKPLDTRPFLIVLFLIHIRNIKVPK
jgi:hypothetical protein